MLGNPHIKSIGKPNFLQTFFLTAVLVENCSAMLLAMRTSLAPAVFCVCFVYLGWAVADEGFLSSSMYCKDAYLELKAKAAPQSEIDSMARSCQAQHERNLSYAEWEKQEAEERLRISKLPRPSIGMNANQVVKKTSWGAPKSVNRTTTATGSTEQWVYGPNAYLYFRNGKLFAIQD